MLRPNLKLKHAISCALLVILSFYSHVAFSQTEPCPIAPAAITQPKGDPSLEGSKSGEVQLDSEENITGNWAVEKGATDKLLKPTKDATVFRLPPEDPCDPGGGCQGPSAQSVSGGGYICSDATYVDPIYQQDSEVGVSYKLWRGSTLLSTKSGTGSALNWGLHSTVGIYSIKATNSCTGSANPVTIGWVSVTNENPLQFTTSGGGLYCGTALSVNLSDSEFDTYYRLYVDTGSGDQPLGNYISGTGAALTWTGLTQVGTYRVYGYRDVCGPMNAVTIGSPVSITKIPEPLLSHQDVVFLCAGQSVTLYINNAQPSTSYQWRKNGVPITGQQNTSLIVSTSGAGEDYYDVVATSGSCSESSLSVKVKAFSIPSSAITPAGPINVCQGDAVTLSAIAGDYNYEWRDASNTLVGTSQTFSPSVSGTYKVTVYVKANTACSSTTPTGVTVNIGAIPAATITPVGATTVCTGTVTLNANTGTGYTHQWKIDDEDILGATSSQHLANRTGRYTVVVTSGGCSKTSSPVDVTVVNLRPDLVPEGPTQFCVGGSVRINAYYEDGYTYQWYKNNSPIAAPQGTSSQYEATQAGDYYVALSKLGCNLPSETISVSTSAAPTSVITPASTTTFCSGGNVVLNGSTGTGYAYQWQQDGSNIAAPEGTAPSLTASTSGNYILITTLAGCAKQSSPVQVTVKPLPSVTVSASGNTTICAGETLKFSAKAEEGTTFQWVRLPSTNVGTGSTYETGVAGSYKAVGTLNGCAASSDPPIALTVNPIPASVASIAGPPTLFAGDKQLYSVPDNTNVDIFLWNIPAGTNIIYQNQKQTSALVGFNQIGEKVISVSARKNGCVSIPTEKIITVSEGAFSSASDIPEEVKVSPDRTHGLPVQGSPIPLTAITQDEIRDVFSGCMGGEYYLGFQLFYDVHADRNTAVNWTAVVDISLLHGANILWTKSMQLDMATQTFKNTIFHIDPIACDGTYKYKIKTKLTNVGGIQAPEQNIYLQPLLHTRLTDVFNPATTISVSHTISNNIITFNWNTVKAIKGYDLEWVYIDNREPYTGTTAIQAFQFKEGVRITTAQNTYKHHMLYPSGKIFYRVRAVGYNPQYPKHRIPGNWFYCSNTGVALTNHSQSKNWTAQTAFAEEGTYKKMISYYDGTLRQRQTQTNLSSDNVTVVGESYYDFEGRKSVDVLPVPASDNTMTFKTSFNTFQSQDASVTPKTSSIQKKFHYDNKNLLNSIMASTSGAAQYYSSGNTSSSILKDYIPNAEGYVYSQTEYLNDGTGRPVRQSGLGPMFGMDGNQVTKYFYGEATRTELVRLFGPNVGNPNHYKKNVTIDANGQASVSYIDMSGKVVATALSGDLRKDPVTQATLTEPLPSYLALPTTGSVIDITSKNSAAKSIVHRILNEAPNTNYIFNYDLSGMGSDVASFGCKSCVYEYTITVTDPDGKLMTLPTIAGNESGNNTSYQRKNLSTGANCSTNTNLSSIQFTLTFTSIGDYTITKQLSVQEQTFDEMKTIVQTTPAVQTTITSITNSYTVDPADCEFCYVETSCTTEANNAINEAISEIADMDCENIMQQIITAEKLERPTNPAYDPTQTDIETNPLYCSYLICTQDKDSDIFEKQMARVTTWTTASSSAYNYHLIATVDNNSPDPFFSNEELNGYNYKSAMATQLANVVIATVDGKVVKGPILDVTNPNSTNLAYYFRGTTSSGGETPLYHILYYNLQSQGASAQAIDEQRWTLFRNFYLEAKRAVKKTIPTYSNCPNAKAKLDLADQLPSGFKTNSDINANKTNTATWGKDLKFADVNGIGTLAGKGIGVDPSDAELESHIARLQLECNTTFSAADITTITNNLREYFKANPDNFLRLILQSDIGSNSYLNTIQSLLSANYGCALTGSVNPIVCGESKTLPPTFGQNLIQNAGFQITSGCAVADQLQYMNTSGSKLTGCATGWKAVWGKPLLKADGETSFELDGGSCSQDAIRNTLVTPLAPGKKYKLKFKYRSLIPLASGLTRVALSRSTAFDTLPSGGGPAHLVFVDEDSDTKTKKEKHAKKQNATTDMSMMMVAPQQYCKMQPTVINMDGSYLFNRGSAGHGNYIDFEIVFTATQASTYIYFWHNQSYETELSGTMFKDVELREVIDSNIGPICFRFNDNQTLDFFKYIPNWAQKIQACKDSAAKEKTYLVQYAVDDYLEEQTSIYYNNYRTNCLAKASEQLKYTYVPKEYHYTLYYYDQAGNLVQTVPPSGVQPLSYTAANNASPATPGHALVTRYEYTSLDQIIKQTTPDAGVSEFYYDKKSQLRLSRNAQQAINNKYSYTKYDKQGRTVEVGEMTTTASPSALLVHIEDPRFPATGIPELPTYPLSDITRTTYDVQNETIIPQLIQQNLRGRISWVEVTDNTGLDKTSTYYSYDIHGNVKSLVQQIPGLDFKRTDYVYDLISGKMTHAFYQTRKPDQFIHRYKYDSDNRLRFVATSSDAYIWNNEAEYKYYAHGPLARVVLGEYTVQGLDYYYTLQGWVKGVNMPYAGDPKADGEGLSTVGKDVFAYTLGYFQNDYKPSNASAVTADTRDQVWSRLNQITGTTGLYNGNISWMITDLLKIGDQQSNRVKGMQAMVYRYDQLNRIRQTYSLANYVDGSGFATRTTSPAAYDETFAYDGNGNLQLLKRRNETGVLADDFTYQYYPGGNKLRQVTPLTKDLTITSGAVTSNPTFYRNIYVSGSAYVASGSTVELVASENVVLSPDVVVQQGADLTMRMMNSSEGIYAYDAIGNLIADHEAGAKITWTPYGKIRTVSTKDGTETVSYLYDGAGNRVAKRVIKPNSSSVTHYVRDAGGNVMAVYTDTDAKEYHIYGSSRLGIYKGGISEGRVTLGKRNYELGNHLGNILSVITDNVMLSAITANATVVRAADYYAFGLEMTGRTFTSASYRYGFNSKENDSPDLGGVSYDYGFRIYNPRIARFLSVDPLEDEYPWYTPYQFAGNSPITALDIDGLEPDKNLNTSESGGSSEGLTRDKFVQLAAEEGVVAGSFSKLSYNKIIGYAFEQAFLDSYGKLRNQQTDATGDPSNPLVKPDATGYGIELKYRNYRKSDVNIFSRCVFYEVKATKGNIGRTKQIRGEIDAVASKKTASGRRATDAGVAQLYIVTFSNVSIKETVKTYAARKQVALFHIKANYNSETGKIGFDYPIPLTGTTFENLIYNLVKSSLIQKSEVEINFNRALIYSGKSNETGQDVDPEY